MSGFAGNSGVRLAAPALGSFLRRLDGRTKLLLTLLLSALVFAVDGLAASAVLLLCFLGVWIAAKLPLKKISSHWRILAGLVVFLTVLQVLFGPGEPVMVRGVLPLKPEGLVRGLMTGCRLAALALLMPMLTLSTDPGAIALALSGLGLNYRAAFIASSAFNLIPAFEDEARGIMDAQKLRGLGAFEDGSLIDKFRAYPALALPLVLGAMLRARLMGIAMDARAFGAFKTRTWLERSRLTVLDFGAVLVCVTIAALALVLNGTLK